MIIIYNQVKHSCKCKNSWKKCQNTALIKINL